MDLVDLAQATAARQRTAPGRRIAVPPRAPTDPHDETPPEARELIAQLGAEVEAALARALQRIQAFDASGRIDRPGLQALRAEVERARRIGVIGQQLGRIAGGEPALARERLHLADLVREALRVYAPEIAARGLEVRQWLAAVEVTSDATLLFSLLQAVLDWAFEHAWARLELKTEAGAWPQHARLLCSFAHRPPDRADDSDGADDGGAVPDTGAVHRAAAAARLDTLTWRLVQQTAAALGLRLTRRDTAVRTTVALEFPVASAPRVLDRDGRAVTRNPPSLVGHHVLAIAARRDLRHLVREALRPLGPRLDFVTSVDEAVSFCRAARPHALVVEHALGGHRLDRLRSELRVTAPGIAFVEIGDAGSAVQTVRIGAHLGVRVGRDAVVAALPAALQHEMTRLESAAAAGG